MPPETGPVMQMPPIVIGGGRPTVIHLPPVVIGGGQPKPQTPVGNLTFKHVFIFPRERIIDPCNNVLVIANMWNFAIGKADLLPDHKEFLQKVVMPLMVWYPSAGTRFVGLASRYGHPQFNLELGLLRALRAQRELWKHLMPYEPLLKSTGPTPRTSTGSQGENFAEKYGAKDWSENARHRAVLVTVVLDRSKSCDVLLKK